MAGKGLQGNLFLEIDNLIIAGGYPRCAKVLFREIHRRGEVPVTDHQLRCLDDYSALNELGLIEVEEGGVKKIARISRKASGLLVN